MTNSGKGEIAACAGLVCCGLTPPGRGAIATVGVRGPGAAAAVARCFDAASGRSLTSLPIGRVVFGRFLSLAGTHEELVVGLIGPDEIEVHCHGGTAAVQAVIEALVAAGCQRATWPEWLNTQERDPLAAAALESLANARTQRTAAILLDQYQGALRRALKQCLVLLSSHPSQSAQLLNEMLSRGDLGRHLTRPWRVVITGAPNVGKSSLINALLGYQRAIVLDQPGTTRDVLTAMTALGGWPVELADTAGLREGGDAIEAEGVARAMWQVAAADLVVEVLDATAEGVGAGIGKQKSEVGNPGPTIHSSTLAILNKCDLTGLAMDGCRVDLRVSAKTGQGIEELCAAISQKLVPHEPQRGMAVPFTEAQLTALAGAQEQLQRGDMNGTRCAIETLL